MLLTPDTSLARICTAALPGKCTVEQIAEKASHPWRSFRGSRQGYCAPGGWGLFGDPAGDQPTL